MFKPGDVTKIIRGKHAGKTVEVIRYLGKCRPGSVGNHRFLVRMLPPHHHEIKYFYDIDLENVNDVENNEQTRFNG